MEPYLLRLRFHGLYILRGLFNALVPDCSLRLNNLRIPFYVLIKQLILNQLLSNRRKTPETGRSAVIDPTTVQIFGEGGNLPPLADLEGREHKPEIWHTGQSKTPGKAHFSTDYQSVDLSRQATRQTSCGRMARRTGSLGL
jgi:hypothetical protein